MHLIVSYGLPFMLMIETSVIGRVVSQSGDQICECKIGLNIQVLVFVLFYLFKDFP